LEPELPIAALLCAVLVMVITPWAPSVGQAAGADAPATAPPNQSGVPIPEPADSAKAQASKEAPKPAKELFGAATTPAPLAARSIGFYAKGCLAGATALPIDGPAWQAMRLSRNRYWGHPELVAAVERLALDAKSQDGWPGLLVGDLSQPRGGPMMSGHASHQVGLDADIWLTPMPHRRLTGTEREDTSALSMLAADMVSVDPRNWTPTHVKLLKRAASYAAVERIFVHPAIKKALCEATANDADRKWLSKVRPMWGHNDHFHMRIFCPGSSTNCEAQPAPADEDGCGKELTRWLDLVREPPKVGTPGSAKPGLTLDQLPADCRVVLATGTADATPMPVSPTNSTDSKKPTQTK
jgi:penicillin-insensitive murein DD-endopeptidase